MPKPLIALLLCLLLPAPALAAWETSLLSHTPEYFLAADKSRKLLFQVEGGPSLPVVTRSFNCIHGRKEGDKQKAGDLRTPEGVYFITHKIEQKLNFMEYGPHAFGLNYPNPADRIRGKTGGGIWLHSKGQPIEGITTRGCLAIDMHDIESLLPVLIPGTPVIIAEHLQGAPFESPMQSIDSASAPPDAEGENSVHINAESSADLCSFPTQAANASSPSALPAAEPMPKDASPSSLEEAVRSQTLIWIGRYLGKTTDIIDLYDKKNFPLGNREKLSSLHARLLLEFQLQHDVFLDRDGIRILEGPGYLVSCFIKSYAYKGVLHHGLMALYWMPDNTANPRIIGEVWISN